MLILLRIARLALTMTGSSSTRARGHDIVVRGAIHRHVWRTGRCGSSV